MKTTLFFLGLYLTTALNAQVVDEKVQSEVNLLKQSNVDTFLVYSLSCNGGLIPLDTCAYEQAQLRCTNKSGQLSCLNLSNNDII